jgi:hypothetical protein
MSEERRKMAWDLVLAVARSGVCVDMSMSEASMKRAWKFVDSFLENEGGDENEQLTEDRDELKAFKKGGVEPPDHDRMRLVAVNRMNTLLHDENKELTKERNELKAFKNGALDDIERFVAKIALQKDDYSELKAKLEEFMNTEVGQVTQEKLSLEFRCQGLEADLNRAKDELTKEREEALDEANRWKADYDLELKAWKQKYFTACDENLKLAKGSDGNHG